MISLLSAAPMLCYCDVLLIVCHHKLNAGFVSFYSGRFSDLVWYWTAL